MTATIPRHRISSVRLTRARRVCSGVVVSVAPASRCAIRPSSVFMPVATTSARAAPAATDVPMNDAVEAFGQRRVRGHRRRSLLDRRALAGQRRLVRRQQMGFGEARVRRDDVARLEHEQIARDDGRRGDLDAVAVSNHGRARRGHRSQRQQGILGAAFLEEADQRVQNDDRGDGDGVCDLTQESRHHGGAEQQPDERARKLSREQAPARRSLRALDLVGADLGQAAPRLLGRETGWL